MRLPALFTGGRAGVVYRVPDRHGVSTIALRRSAMADEELVSLLRYRLGQYVHPSISIIDPRLVYESRMEHEPLENEAPGDIHFISGAPGTGEILCYAVLRALPDPPRGKTMRDRDRPFLPVEKVHGWGVFNRLQILPDLPLAQVFELGRYVKNHCLPTMDERSTRAPTEIALAVFRALAGPLRGEVGGFVGDLEERIAKRTLDLFHIPTVLIRGVVPYAPEASYFFPRNQYCTVYPFAALVADLEGSLPRFAEVDEALELEGREGLKAMFALKRTSESRKSSLEPPGGLAPLNADELPDQGGEMRLRREILDIAEHLRSFEPFSNLSDAEMRLLGAFMERRAVPAGEILVRQDEIGDDLFLIEEGEAEVSRRVAGGPPTVLARLGPAQYFGEIALLHDGRRTADVRAVTAMSVLRLCKAAYTRFLARLEEVQGRIARTAAERSSPPAVSGE
ncbi:MAG TPA: cyclic nucleotide-binding domain-containing protein [Armatimonadota bacterium]|nr:cyclic nucleotide-binding domain-containing protein [Armatimonadota bacterium]